MKKTILALISMSATLSAVGQTNTIKQYDEKNSIIVEQEGYNNNTTTVNQFGDYSIFQLTQSVLGGGDNNSLKIDQSGSANSANIIQKGFGNTINLTQNSNDIFFADQEFHNTAEINQNGFGNILTLVQDGSGNQYYSILDGNDNNIQVNQTGDNGFFRTQSIMTDLSTITVDQTSLSSQISINQSFVFLSSIQLSQSGAYSDVFIDQFDLTDSKINLVQSGGEYNNFSISQNGNNNTIDGVELGIAAMQIGSNNITNLVQSGGENIIKLYQQGDNNLVQISQSGTGNIASISLNFSIQQ
jgi:hypothetical protein